MPILRMMKYPFDDTPFFQNKVGLVYWCTGTKTAFYIYVLHSEMEGYKHILSNTCPRFLRS